MERPETVKFKNIKVEDNISMTAEPNKPIEVGIVITFGTVITGFTCVVVDSIIGKQVKLVKIHPEQPKLIRLSEAGGILNDREYFIHEFKK